MLSVLFSKCTGKWIGNIFTCSNSLTPSTVKQLLHCIQDSYVANKILAVELLNNLVAREVLVEYMDDLIGLAHNMMCGAKAADCSSSAYYVRLFMNVDSVKLLHVIRELNLNWVTELKQTGKLHQDTSYSSITNVVCVGASHDHKLMVLVELVNFLQLQLSLAQDNLLCASVETPVYGVLEVIRVSLETVELRYKNVKRCGPILGNSFYSHEIYHRTYDYVYPLIYDLE